MGVCFLGMCGKSEKGTMGTIQKTSSAILGGKWGQDRFHLKTVTNPYVLFVMSEKDALNVLQVVSSSPTLDPAPVRHILTWCLK